ncbi:MAG TPA: hypothetical protein VN238_06815, partial [Solirubrobacteraceae bacterium]|nr:hypothetical protein [Solirubrobacteraceae bacterium]
MRTLLTTLLAATAMLVAAPLASAAPPADGGPADGVLVAGPAGGTGSVPSTTRLYAGHWDRTVCIAFSADAARPEERLDDGGGISGYPPRACGHVAREDADAPFVMRISTADDADSTRPDPADADVAYAVRPDVAAVEMEGPGRRTVRLATVPPPPALAGTAAGELRYVLGRAPADIRTWRLIDAAGTVLYEGEKTRFGEVDGRLVRGPVRIASGGRGAGAWRFTAEIRSVLAPLPGQPSRRVRALCHTLL